MKQHTPFKSKFNAAFSLVELLVVIAVIAIIAAIAIPNITGIREGAKASKWASDKASVERRVGEAAALGVTVTTQEVLDGVEVTDPDTDMVINLQVPSDFTAEELDAATAPE
jgi:prepilin-type N-terminal cleavage/methylation domain-containing protein